MDILTGAAAVLSHWKEIGSVGAALYLGYLILAKFIDWSLDYWGIKIKRKQSHEDVLEAKVQALADNVAAQEKRLTRVENAYDFMHDVAHKAADGIDIEMKNQGWISPAIAFFVGQLRAIQAIEEILKD